MEKTRLPDDIRALNARLLTEPELTENVGPVHVLTVIGRASGKRQRLADLVRDHGIWLTFSFGTQQRRVLPPPPAGSTADHSHR